MPLNCIRAAPSHTAESQVTAHTNPLELSTTKPQSSLSQWRHVKRDSLLCMCGHWRNPLHSASTAHAAVPCQAQHKGANTSLPSNSFYVEPWGSCSSVQTLRFSEESNNPARTLPFMRRTRSHGQAACDKGPTGLTAHQGDPNNKAHSSSQTGRHP